jgi:hypothetical protein
LHSVSVDDAVSTGTITVFDAPRLAIQSLACS